MYSFENHQRLETTNRIYSPHVLILEGIFALYDEQILDMLDMKIFAEADADLCLARRSMLKQTWFCCSPANVKTKQVTRDVKERGRDLEGCIKQWISWVKPNFQKFVEPQRNRAGEYD
jgi:uridine kinase